MKRISMLLLLGLCIGCASQRTRITVTRVHGEPSISIEFEDRGLKHEDR